MKMSALLVTLLGASMGSAWGQGALAAGVPLDNGSVGHGGSWSGRAVLIGLKGKGGMPTFGHQLTLDFSALPDVGAPFNGGMAASAANIIDLSARREDHNIYFYRSELHRVSAAASATTFAASSYGSVASADKQLANRAWGISVGVQHGPWMLRAAHQNRMIDVLAPASAMGNNLEAKNTIVAANLRLGHGSAYAAYSANRGWSSSPLWNPDNPYGAAITSTPSTDSRDVLVGFALPVGATTWLASYIRKNDRDLANRDADQVAIGATYALSQRTDFYASYSRITNRTGVAATVGNAAAPGGGSSALNIGMRHAF